MTSLMHRLLRETEGQDLIEYALLATFISLIAVITIVNLGTGVNAVWGGVDNQMGNAAAGAS